MGLQLTRLNCLLTRGLGCIRRQRAYCLPLVEDVAVNVIETYAAQLPLDEKLGLHPPTESLLFDGVS